MLRHEQQTVRTALAAALHLSSGKVHAEYGALRGLKTATRAGKEVEQPTPPPGSRRSPGRGRVAAGPPSLVVAPVAVHDDVDAATVQFFLHQSFLARAAEEEKAREEAEVKMLEDELVDKESLL